MEILSSLKKQPSINEAVLRVSHPLSSFQLQPRSDRQPHCILLQESKAGLAVGKLRSHTDKRVSEAAKDIVKKWKNDVEKAKRTTSGTPEHHSPSTSKPSTYHTIPVFRRSLTTFAAPKKPVISTTTSSKINSVPPSITSPAIPKIETRTAKGDGVSANWTGDKTRDRCIELLYDALALESGARTSTACLLPSLPDPCYPTANDLIAQRAVAIEKAVADELGVNSGGYKAKIRSLFVNLKDKNNPSLRESVVSGDVSPIKFANMTSEVCARHQTKKCG